MHSYSRICKICSKAGVFVRFEKSCGAVVYHIIDSDQNIDNNSNIEFLIIKHKSGEHWGFPKGHVEAAESEVETALREVMEETGVAVEISDGFSFRMKYSPKVGTMKEVVYFLGEAFQREVLCQESEISDFKWLDLKGAVKMVTHENSRKLLREAYFYIKDNHKKKNRIK